MSQVNPKEQKLSVSQVELSAGSSFTIFAEAAEVEQLETFVAPCARKQFHEILDAHCAGVKQLSETCLPFQHILHSPLAGQLLPLLPPDYAGCVWHLIDTVSKRVYAQFF